MKRRSRQNKIASVMFSRLQPGKEIRAFMPAELRKKAANSSGAAT
jgi:hypothetical protein